MAPSSCTFGFYYAGMRVFYKCFKDCRVLSVSLFYVYLYVLVTLSLLALNGTFPVIFKIICECVSDSNNVTCNWINITGYW